MNPRGEDHSRFRAPATFFSRSNLFWKLQIVGWAVFLVVSLPLKRFVFDDASESVAFMTYRDGPAFLLTLVFRYAYATIYPARLPFSLLSVAVAGLSLVGGLVLTFWTTIVYRLLGLPGFDVLDELSIYRVLYLCTSICLCWSLLYFGIRLLLDSAENDVRLARAETQWRDAELKMLRAQMNPHFLFNALTAIRTETGQRAPDLSALVQALADYLKFSLVHSNDPTIPVGKEFDAMVDYLTVEKARYRDDFEYDCFIDDSLRQVPVPGVLLQPLIENAIKYGRKTSTPPLRVELRVSSSRADTLEIEVVNSGRWVEAGGNSNSTLVGHQNLRSRLALLYPQNHVLEVQRGASVVTVRVSIPISS